MSIKGKLTALDARMKTLQGCLKLPYPASLAAMAMAGKMKQIAMIPHEEFNDDGTRRPAILEGGKPIAYSSKVTFGSDLITETDITINIKEEL